METRLLTRIRAGRTRRYYQQFGSSTDTDEESSGVFLSSAQADTNEEQELGAQPETLPPIEIPLTSTNIPEKFFSENEMIEAYPSEQGTQQPINETATSLIGTSAPLLSNPSLTDVQSNFPWPQLDHPITHDPHTATSMKSQNRATSSTGAQGHASSVTAQEESKSVGQPPASTTTSKNKSVQSRCKGMRKRGRPRGRPPKKAPIPIQQTASVTSNFEVSGPSAHVTTDKESFARAPRYRCGTCGLCDCNCNLLINRDDLMKPRGVPAVNEGAKLLMEHRLKIRAEKT